MGNGFLLKIMMGINKLKQKLKNINRESGAQASLEFVLVVPFVILIIIAVSHLGLLIYQKSVLQQAAREGARIVATTNSNSKAMSCIREICSGLEQGRIGIEIIPKNSSSRKVGDIVEITVSYSYGDAGSLMRIFAGKNKVIKAKSDMRMECY